MSQNIHQIFVANPITSNTGTDLMYFGQSPYGATNDAAMTYTNFSAQFVLSSAIVNGAHGGTGVNNGASTITLGGSLTTSGAFTSTFTMTNTTSVTFPTSGTLATTSQIPSFPLSLANGGTNANLTAANGGIVYSSATALAILAPTATANQILMSGSNTTPAWSTATFASTYSASTLLYSNGANTVTGLTTADSAVLVTSAAGVPAWSGTMTNGQLIIVDVADRYV